MKNFMIHADGELVGTISSGALEEISPLPAGMTATPSSELTDTSAGQIIDWFGLSEGEVE